MLTDAEIIAATPRLVAGKLTNNDVDDLVSAFRMLVGSLESQYEYEFDADLTALDDTGGSNKAAKMAAVIIRLKADGGSSFELDSEVKLSDADERRLAVLFAFSILYPIPEELTDIQILLNAAFGAVYSHNFTRTRTWE